jgi:hypothetical protein
VLLPLIRTVIWLDEMDLTPVESESFHERYRQFLVDHERGKNLSTVIDGKPETFGKASADGRFGVMEWRELADGRCAVVGSGDWSGCEESCA